MPEIWIWWLLASLLMLAIGTSIKAVESSYLLNIANKEIERLRKQIEMLDLKKDDVVLNTGQLESESLKHAKTSLVFDPQTGTWIDESTSLRYCAKCKAGNLSVPLQNCEHGWSCPACNGYYADPSRPEPPMIFPSSGRWDGF